MPITAELINELSTIKRLKPGDKLLSSIYSTQKDLYWGQSFAGRIDVILRGSRMFKIVNPGGDRVYKPSKFGKSA